MRKDLPKYERDNHNQHPYVLGRDNVLQMILLVTSLHEFALVVIAENVELHSLLYYCDVIMDAMASPASRLSIQPLIQAQIRENVKGPRHWSLWGEFTGEFPAQVASNAENVFIWWRHHDISHFRIRETSYLVQLLFESRASYTNRVFINKY